MLNLTDEQARKVIINELNKNIFVIAGAGSGKTFMLVNRMVALVESGVDISKICAITFTINAAAEFLERLNKTLKRRSLGIQDSADYRKGGLGDITPEKQRYDANALKNIDLCFAGTIDSFCNLMLSQYPLDAHIPSSSSVLTDEEAAILYKKEYAKLSILKKDDDNYQAFVKLFKNPSEIFVNSIDDAIAVSFFNVVYDKPTCSLDTWVNDFKKRYQTLIQKDLKNIMANESSLKRNKEGELLTYNQKAFDVFAQDHKRFLNDWNLDTILRLPNYRKNGIMPFKFNTDPNVGGCIVFEQSGKDYVYQKDCPFDDAIKEIQRVKHSFAIDFLLSCAKTVRGELKEKGKLTFSEYLFTFKELIKNDLNGDGSPIINHIRERFQYFLLDESQDTNPFQYELFLYLNSTKKAQKIDDVKLIPGSLFIVGDPKQSIYRFRNADIHSYNSVKALFSDEDNIAIELTDNFRSTKKLCEYFNDCFQTKKQLDDYTPISNVDEKNTDGYEGLFTYSDYIEVIKTIIDNPQYQILKDGVPTKIDYQDIMIITKSKKNKLSILVKELEQENIPCYAEDDNLLSDYDVVSAISAAYSYIAFPNDRQYFYNLMTSPLFQLTPSEAFCVDENKLLGEQKTLLNKLRELKALCLDPVILFESLLENLEIFKLVSNKRLDFAYYILNKIKEAYTANQITSIEDSALFLNDLLIEKQERIAQLSKKPNAIRISNVHKVKGLEAPVVILIKAGADPGAKNKITRHIEHINNESYFFRVGKKELGLQTVYESDYIYDINEQKLDEEFLESQKEFERLQYVAVTRARDYLFIPNDEKYNVWYELITNEFKAFEPDFERINAFDQRNNNVPNGEIYGDSVTPSFIKNESYTIVLPSKLTINHEGNSEEKQINSAPLKSAAEKGTLIHALMEIYVTSKFKYSNQDVVEETLARYNQSANKEYYQMLTDVINTMTSGGYLQASGQKEDIISILKKADEIYCEMPFSYQEGNQIFNGSIDLFYKLDDKYYIVDYKTNYDDTDLDNKYENQLKAYQKAVKNIKNIDASARIYHIDVK